ncbi:putative beta-D-xylosidase 6 [Camellia lanceoleosa]|nr:putative beta-D-xylosidase 6 [Camellia lanceoleosa]
MSTQRHRWRRFLNFLTLFFFFIRSSSSSSTSQPITSNRPHLQFPCTPPHHNSYPFCNTSLPIKPRAQSLISLLSLSEKIQQLCNNATSIPRLGIPSYEWWSESLHGIASNGPGITFNGSIQSATSFPCHPPPRLLQSKSLAVDCRRDCGENWRVGAGIGIGFGEKRVLADGDDGGDGLMLSACCKHFTAYDLENWGTFTRYNFNAVVSQQDLEDTYQPPFRSCIQQGKASCLMCSYNAVNGIPACADKELLQTARDKWGFKGWKKKTRQSSSQFVFSSNCLGLFDGDPIKRQFGKLGPQHVCSSEHKALALEAARQGIVLLKNEKKFLPLNKNKMSSLAVIGPMANSTQLGGGYTGVPCSPKSLLDAFQAYAKKTSYAAGCLDGVPCYSNAGFIEALSIAKEADFVIVVAGLDLSQETEDHDRYSLLLPGYQMALVTTIASVSKKPLVLVLTGGGPLDVSFAEGDSKIASILWIGYPGETGGKALAEVIFGDYNPGGRLPMTWYPESFTSVPMNDMNMRADPSRGYPGRTYRFYTGDRVYGFGHGLSYTNFTYKLLSAPNKLILLASTKAESRKNMTQQRGYKLDYIHIDEVEYCDSLIFHVSVTNNGDMDGSHVVMLFSRVLNFFKGAPEKQLIGFERVHTISYRSTETSIVVDTCKHLSIANEYGRRILPLGKHTLMLSDIEHIVSIETQ